MNSNATPGAQAKHAIRGAQKRQYHLVRQRRQPVPAQRQRVILGQDPLGLVGGDDRNIAVLGQGTNSFGRTMQNRTDAGDDNGPM